MKLFYPGVLLIMPLTDSDYNQFARALARCFAQRSKGLDEDSRRIVGARPADHILAGFLTPVRPSLPTAAIHVGSEQNDAFKEDDDLDDESLLVNDLPRDSAYEQTALGVEWITLLDQMQADSVMTIELQMCIYVRRFPTFQEQSKKVSWERQPAGTNSPRQSVIAQAWTREELLPIRREINLGSLKSKRQIAIDISQEMTAAWVGIDKTFLYRGQHRLTIAEPDLASAPTYNARLVQLQSNKMPVNWKPVIDVRLITTPTEPGCARVALRVINQTDSVRDQFLDYVDPNLYAVQLKVSVPKDSHRMAIFRELPDSFRYDREMFGIGINTHVDGHIVGNQIVLETDSIPMKQVDRLEPREISNATPRFDFLAADPVPILQRILDDMNRYNGNEWAQKIASLKDVERNEAISARDSFRSEIARFERGVKLLEDARFSNVKRAFCLMNRAMGQAARGKYQKWHLFQIAFIVSQIPSLAAREYPELTQPGDDYADVLWFAAGGGKTEAFLGLIIWQAFFDRLRGKQFGVTAYVRFPLRLLAFQQVRRLGRALAAAEVIRAQEKLGGAKFSIGDFVGSNVTPNSVSDAEHKRFKDRGVDKRFQRISECPFCDAEVRLGYDADLRLIKHVCTNPNCREGADRLPIYIVDTDVYRFLPTVIVSTVDKIALLGYNKRFANLFGRFDLICYSHGASFSDINKNECEAAKAFTSSTRLNECGGKPVRYGPFHDPAPSLLIQDELHLLSEDVGAFDAHYETAVMEMAQSLGAQPWKIIAATATIEEYEQHAYQLYLKRARQFPGPGPEAYESFYYRQNPDKIGRIFIGVLGIGRKHTPAVSRALSNVYIELQAARELAEANPATAAARYGTSLLSREEFRELVFYYELPLTYVLTRKGSDQVAEAIESRVKSDLRELAPNHGELIVDMFNGGVDFSEMAAAMQRISSAKPDGNPEERIRGLVATSIIGHGVDVDRFNIIVFAGFTRLVAEYIQASARVGRTWPGISIFVATPQNERDRSIFDRFAKFHEYLDRLVDPSAVNRWSDPALQRTMPGLLAGYLMGVAAHQMKQPIASVEDVLSRHASAKAEALNEQEIVKWLDKAYGADQAPSPERYRDRIANQASNTYRLIINRTKDPGGRPLWLGNHLGAMQSLRDVDDPAYIRVSREDDKNVIRRLING